MDARESNAPTSIMYAKYSDANIVRPEMFLLIIGKDTFICKTS